MSIQSVDRALQALSLFSYKRPLLGISEISRLLGLSKPTVHGLVRTLLDQRYLRQDPTTKKYHLGLKVYELGIVFSVTLDLNLKGSGPVYALAKRAQLLSRIAMWEGYSVVITLNAHPRTGAAIFPHQIGPRVHAYCTAIGKAVLAFLGEQELKEYLDRTKLVPFTNSTITKRKLLLVDLMETRERGYSFDREESVQGLGCIAAPVFKAGGNVIGSISLSGDSHKIFGERKKEFCEDIVKTAGEVSQYMGHFMATFET